MIPFKTKLILLGFLIAVIVSFICGRLLAPKAIPQTKIVTQERIVYKDRIVNVDKVVTVFKKNGDKVIIKDKSKIDEQQFDRKDKATLDSSIVIPQRRLEVKVDSIHPTKSQIALEYSQRIAGPVSVSVGSALDFKQVWVGVGVDF
jgi:hypothetical protein